jgi:hypothetical protein
VVRGSPTDADRALVAYLAEFGYPVKAATLEYWRGQGALPPRKAPGRGRGRGRGSADPPETAARALGICRFLDKSEDGIPDRPDLPRRRRVAEAPLWLWYERYPIPNEAIRDAVGACYLGLQRRLGGRPALAAVEAEVAGMHKSEPFRRQVRAFERLPSHPREHPRALAESATSQLLQALQGDVEVEADVFPVVFEYPLVLAGATDEPLTAPPDAEALAELLATETILRKIASMTGDDWRDVREVLRAIQGDVIRLAGNEDQVVRRTARSTPLANNATRLVAAIGALAVTVETMQQAVSRTTDSAG